MKKSIAAFVLCLLPIVNPSIIAREYGGRWDEESIREFSLKYIDKTKERFAARAARLGEVLEDHPAPLSTAPSPNRNKRLTINFSKIA